ncbi:sensor histidine kinase [Kitasatospora sp. NPDC087314]|uniref:sensor histidine kinase n=1 Tax=Kitasatospora sp. NPDC087314 TaxID=3364068 RepID=UPI0038278597
MAPTSRNPFTAPGEQGRGLWRALAEVTGGAWLMLLTQEVLRRGPSGEIQLLLGAVALALLAVRRRLPTVSLLGVSAVVGLLPAAGLPAAMTAYTTAKHLVVPRRRSTVLLAPTGLATLTCAAFAPGLGLGSHPFGFALGAVLAATTLIVPGLLGMSGGQEVRLLRALRERADAAEAARRLADSESRMHERSRIAAEMHDLVGHRLSLISLHAGGLEMALQKESPELRDEAVLVRRATGDAMRELREVLGVLGPLGRDTGTDALTDSTGTRSDVEALAEESRGGGIPVDLTWDGPDLTDRAAQVRRAVHRVVRESLTNVHRYAAGARVTVVVTHTDSRVEVLVRNGLPPVAPEAATGLGSGRGLVGLRERVALLGGTLEAGPTPTGGFAVTARIPARPDPGASLAAVGAPPREPPSEPHSDDSPAGVQRRVVSALSGLLGLIGVGVMMMCGFFLVTQAFPDPAPRDPEQPRIGMSRAMVEKAVYGDNTSARAAATGREPAHPVSVTSCMYSTFPFEDSTPPAEDAGRPGDSAAAGAKERPDHLRITRFCFRGDTLATIDRFTVPVVSRTPPWESP